MASLAFHIPCNRSWHGAACSRPTRCSILHPPWHMQLTLTRRQIATARCPLVRPHAQPPWQDVEVLNAGKSWTEQRGEEINSQVCEVADVDRTAELLLWLFTSLFSRGNPPDELVQAGQGQEDKYTRVQESDVRGPLVVDTRPNKMVLQELSDIQIVGIIDNKQG